VIDDGAKQGRGAVAPRGRPFGLKVVNTDLLRGVGVESRLGEKRGIEDRLPRMDEKPNGLSA
jgi:hypothetical protein